MTFQRSDNNAHLIDDHVTKKQLREAMRTVSAKHRRNRHSRQLGECQKIECQLCQFVFDHAVSQRGETVVCPSCGVAFEIASNVQVDSVRVSEIEKEVSQLHEEIEKRLPRKRENSVIGPLPLQTMVQENHNTCCDSRTEKNKIVPIKKRNIQFAYDVISEHRVRSEVVHLACHPNSARPSQIAQDRHAQQATSTEKIDERIDECDITGTCNHTQIHTVDKKNTTNLLFQELKAGRKKTTIHFCVAGVFIGIIICMLIILASPENDNTRYAHVRPEIDEPKIVNELLVNQTAERKTIVSAFNQRGTTSSGINNGGTPRPTGQIITEHNGDVNNSNDLKKELDKTQSELESIKQYCEGVIRTQESLSQGSKQFEAESLLWEAYANAEKDPSQSTILALQAIQRFQEIGLDVPSNARWALNQSLAAQGLGISFDGFEDGVKAITVSQDGQWALIAADNGNIWLWELSKHDQTSEKFLLDTLTEDVSQLSILSDLSWAICLTKNGNVRLWDLSLQYPSQQPFDIRNTSYSLEKMVVSADGHWLVISASDRQNKSAPTLLLWDLKQLAQQRQLPQPVIIKGHEKNIRSIAISKDSRWLASGGDDKTVRLYDLTSPANPASNPIVLQSHELEVIVVAFSPDGKWLASGGRDSIIRIWNIQDTKKIGKPLLLQHHQGWLSSLEFSSDNKYLAAGSYDRTISIWRFNANNQQELAHVLRGHRGAIKTTIFSAHGDMIVSHGYDREVHVWNLLQGNPSDNSLVFRSMPTPFSAVQLTNDDRWLVLAQEKGKPGLRLWPLQFEETLACAVNYAQTQYTDVLTTPTSPTAIATANQHDYSVPGNYQTPPIHQASAAQATNR